MREGHYYTFHPDGSVTSHRLFRGWHWKALELTADEYWHVRGWVLFYYDVFGNDLGKVIPG